MYQPFVGTNLMNLTEEEETGDRKKDVDNIVEYVADPLVVYLFQGQVLLPFPPCFDVLDTLEMLDIV